MAAADGASQRRAHVIRERGVGAGCAGSGGWLRRHAQPFAGRRNPASALGRGASDRSRVTFSSARRRSGHRPVRPRARSPLRSPCRSICGESGRADSSGHRHPSAARPVRRTDLRRGLLRGLGDARADRGGADPSRSAPVHSRSVSRLGAAAVSSAVAVVSSVPWCACRGVCRGAALAWATRTRSVGEACGDRAGGRAVRPAPLVVHVPAWRLNTVRSTGRRAPGRRLCRRVNPGRGAPP